jgi:hypothetical protein
MPLTAVARGEGKGGSQLGERHATQKKGGGGTGGVACGGAAGAPAPARVQVW